MHRGGGAFLQMMQVNRLRPRSQLRQVPKGEAMNFRRILASATLSIILFCGLLSVATRADDAITLPKLIGLDKDEAIMQLAKLGLRHELGTKNICSKKDTISQQQPPPGTRLPLGAVVLLWVDPMD